MATKQITAVLDAGVLQGEIEIPEVLKVIYVVLLEVPMRFSVHEDMLPSTEQNCKQATFEWREQIGQYTHRYTLTNI